jgi:acetylornithine deacetylase
MTVTDILERLIAFPSIVGTPNGNIVDWIRSYLEGHGARVVVLVGPEGDRSNLFATFGPSDRSGYILSGHMDVVPAKKPGWTSDPFQLRQVGERLYGRGSSDMKGFLAACLAAAPALAGRKLTQPVHLAFSYDEEAGCRGVPHLIARVPDLCAPPAGAIIGEPSKMQAILAHKGKAAVRVTMRGRAGHSSRPDLGINAIHAMAGILSAAVANARDLAEGPFDPTFEPPYSSLQIGVITGGQAVNIIPDLCEVEFEARAIAGVDPLALLAPIRQQLDVLIAAGADATWTEMSAYPALSLPETAALARLLEELSGHPLIGAVSYGTEAGLYQAAGIDSIICGPGDINRAHKPDEYILTSELAACQAMIEALGARCSG